MDAARSVWGKRAAEQATEKEFVSLLSIKKIRVFLVALQKGHQYGMLANNG